MEREKNTSRRIQNARAAQYQGSLASFAPSYSAPSRDLLARWGASRRSVVGLALIRVLWRLNTRLLLAIIAVVGVERGAGVLGLLAVGRRSVVSSLLLRIVALAVCRIVISLLVAVHLLLVVLFTAGGHPTGSVHGLIAATATATSSQGARHENEEDYYNDAGKDDPSTK